MKIPIVLAAFGTTTRAMKTYSFIHEICRERFPDHPIHWAFSSRVVKDLSNQRFNTNMQHPHEVLEKLAEKQYPWAVVQSLHFMCGHEFYRLVEDVRECRIRTAMGLPLLSEPRDYQEIVTALSRTFPACDDEAVILVGHGTDHPGWCSYVALDHIFRKTGRKGIYVGVVERGYPAMESVVAEVRQAGYKQVKLIPFLLVAGMHFEEDLSADEDSWKYAFETAGISVTLENQGLGFNEGIVNIFCRHIGDALDVIPGRESV
jgi:sirohydrochlorin cobaltochelatase